ncbi:MAG: diguanylate cyclase [Armatimonadetes bacterium]|nr:diguanylate cyclase [Armatimonadota bacterium]
MNQFEVYSDVLIGGLSPRVLVVEDDPVAAKVVQRLLKEQGIDCDLAINGSQALEMYCKHRYRLVVSDWMMPEMSGVELCEALRNAETSYTYIILCTSKNDRSDRLEAYDAGVDEFLTKPLDREELLGRLKSARRILASEDNIQRQKWEIEKAHVIVQEMNANLTMASRRFEELFNGLPVACFTFDQDGVIHEWNRAAEAAFGIPSYKAFQTKVWDVFGMHGSTVWNTPLVEKVATEGSHDPFDWEYEVYNGLSRHLACSIFALRNNKGEFIGAISANLDITERLEAQRRIEEQMRQINEFAHLLEQQKGALEQANELLALRADTDGLTGLLNHRRFKADLEAACLEAEETQRPLSVILLDVDYFKAYNDTFGHQAGDDVLRHFATLLRQSSREDETVSRYGGEEFAVILRGCSHEAGVRAAERFRSAVESAKWMNRDVTASFGVATFAAGKRWEQILSEADIALYYSKEQGRNRVSHFDELPEGTQKRTKGIPDRRAA